MKMPIPLLLLVILGITLGAMLAPPSTDPEQRSYPCEKPQTDWEHSAYVLPYPIGASYKVNQANCSGHGHKNFWNHGYDFIMPIGSAVTASRSGVVAKTHDGCADGDGACTNLVVIRHDDGTVALYSHLTRRGVKVGIGQAIHAGELIGFSGNTGNTGGLPHLHFSVHPCDELPGIPKAGICPSRPVSFRNTGANPDGLLPLYVYAAMPVPEVGSR
jgi:murein DD-endopeptidase MepM/ murein hydrolase activator NlpD